MDSERGIQEWIGELTAAGWDIAEIQGWTTRGDGWNVNHPMPSITILFRAEKKPDIVLKSYATNSRNWTTYATGFHGKAPNRVFGFRVVGTREVAISDFDSLISYIGEDA